jgi:quinoprotein glucose dehydrogenase
MIRVDTALKRSRISCGILSVVWAIGTLAATPDAPRQTPSRSVWDGVYTEAQAKRGKELYGLHCLTCHGESLEGGGPAKPLVGPEFGANWNGLTMGDLLERTRVSMPLDKPGTLSRAQLADVLSFVLSANKFPAGDVELPRQPEMLSQITFLTTKPGAPDVPRDAPPTLNNERAPWKARRAPSPGAGSSQRPPRSAP